MLLREVGEIDKMFLTQKGNENEEISRSLEADQIHTKVRHNQPYNPKAAFKVYQT